MRRFAAVAGIVVGTALGPQARADETCDGYLSGDTYVVACSEPGADRRQEHLRMPFVVAAVDEVRAKLEAAGTIMPGLLYYRLEAKKTPGFVYEAARGGPLVTVQHDPLEQRLARYSFRGFERSFRSLCALLLRHLGRMEEEVWTGADLRPSDLAKAQAYVGVEVRGLTVTSPTDALSFTPVWRNGSLRYETRDEADSLLGNLTISPATQATLPLWSPDGQTLVVGTTWGAYLYRAPHLTRRAVTRARPPRGGDRALDAVLVSFQQGGRFAFIEHWDEHGSDAHSALVVETATGRSERCWGPREACPTPTTPAAELTGLWREARSGRGVQP